MTSDIFLDMRNVKFSYGHNNAFSDEIVPVIKAWQNRLLSETYSIVWFDTVNFNVRDNGIIQRRVIFSVLGITLDGQMNVIGVYFADDESNVYWQQILNDLKKRGIKKIHILCVDPIGQLNSTIEKIFPGTKVQLCLVHLIRNSVKYLDWGDVKPCLTDLKKILMAKTIESADIYFAEAENNWKDEYPIIFSHWRNNWGNIIKMFQYPPTLRKVLYTTYSIEGYHQVVKRITDTKGAFCFESTIIKKVYSETLNSRAKWRGKVSNWLAVRNDIINYFRDSRF